MFLISVYKTLTIKAWKITKVWFRILLLEKIYCGNLLSQIRSKLLAFFVTIRLSTLAFAMKTKYFTLKRELKRVWKAVTG